MQRPDSKQSSLWKGLNGKGSNSAKMVGPGWRAVCVGAGGCIPPHTHTHTQCTEHTELEITESLPSLSSSIPLSPAL